MKEIAKMDPALVKTNLALIQEKKALERRIWTLEQRNRALQASIDSARARRNERIARQRRMSAGMWPKIKTAMLTVFNLSVAVFLAVRL